MEALNAGVGFAQQLLVLARAMGLDVDIVDDQNRRMLKNLDEANVTIKESKQNIDSESEQIKNMVNTAVVVGVCSRLDNVKSIPSDKINLLIRLFFCLKEKASNVVFAVFVKYKIGERFPTLGFAGATSDRIEDLVMKVDSFLRTLSHVSVPKTAYASIKIRGKYDPDIESFCTAVLTTIVIDVCGLSRDVELEDRTKCIVTARGEKTIIMLEPTETEEDREDYDRLRRVFLIGDTSSGKSTLGNAIAKKDTFMTSKGTTGTIRIERSELVEDIEDERWVTEFYDTPALNNKDGLDVWHESAIEDLVRILQKTSSFIMTISIDGGITGSALTSLKSYKSLFGSSMASMMVVVLTVNEPAGKDDLKSYCEVNIPTVLGLDETICEENIYCASLYDLRGQEKSASHDVVESIRNRCRSMPMKFIEALLRKYQDIHHKVLRKSGDLKREVQRMIDVHWQRYEDLTKRYDRSRSVEVKDESEKGFVIQNPKVKDRCIAIATLGRVMITRRTIINVSLHGSAAKSAWKNFSQQRKLARNHHCMMRNFGNLLSRQGMAVKVKDPSVVRDGNLRERKYRVIVFDLTDPKYEKLATFLQGTTQKKNEESTPDDNSKLSQTVPSSAAVSKPDRTITKEKQFDSTNPNREKPAASAQETIREVNEESIRDDNSKLSQTVPNYAAVSKRDGTITAEKQE